MILFDCERLKHPFQGFYTYCDSLGRALSEEARKRSETMAFYVPEKDMGRFGDDMRYLKCGKFDRLYLKSPSYVDLWHCARQRSGYIPDSGRAQVLLTVHDINFFLAGPREKRPRYKIECQRSIDRADRIVTISEFARKQLLESDLDLYGMQVDVVYNGVPDYNGTPKRPAYVPEEPYLLCVSRIARLKNYEVLPPLLVGNDMKLLLVGNMDKNRYEERVLEAAKKFGVADRVVFTGPVDEDEKYWYMQHCRAFVFPSLAEGFGLPVLEAMRCGRPVFVSDRMSIPEITGEHGFYFNHDFDPDGMREEFEKGMERFESGDFDIQAMIDHANSYSWATAASQYFDIYEDMLRNA